MNFKMQLAIKVHLTLVASSVTAESDEPVSSPKEIARSEKITINFTNICKVERTVEENLSNELQQNPLALTLVFLDCKYFFKKMTLFSVIRVLSRQRSNCE
jgi:hypothetical protein